MDYDKFMKIGLVIMTLVIVGGCILFTYTGFVMFDIPLFLIPSITIGVILLGGLIGYESAQKRIE